MTKIQAWITSRRHRKFTDVLWNSIGGGLYAGQAAILLIAVSRIASQEIAGIVSIGYAIAYLFASIGKYGVRNYQVTDIDCSLTFFDYYLARCLTTAIAAALFIIYILLVYRTGSYSREKTAMIAEIVILKLIDDFEDVYFGRYQQIGFFQTGAKIMAIHQGSVTLGIIISMVITQNVLIAFAVGIVLSVIALFYLLEITKEIVDISIDVRPSILSIRKILKQCLPLCIGTTLAIYVGNIPKYAIDLFLDETAQAIFGYLMLPVFVITLLNQFIYQPMVKELGDNWHNKEINSFAKKILIQCSIVTIISVGVLLAALWIGIPLLSLVYNIQLIPYREEFVILLIGGSVYTIAYYLTIPITTMHKQGTIGVGYIISSIVAFVLQRPLVTKYGIVGAGIVYIAVNFILVLCFTFIIIQSIVKESEWK